MKFAGRVSQLITASTGLDDWEWGVTLWARNPLYLKDIVYTMRFDESSARYALFGDFYFGYILPPRRAGRLPPHLRRLTGTGQERRDRFANAGQRSPARRPRARLHHVRPVADLKRLGR